MNNGTPCLFEAARRSLAAPKPSVDHLQLTQLGMSRRLLNPQLYELHDDASETAWTGDDAGEQTHNAPYNSQHANDLTSETVKDSVDEMEINGQSASDQEEIWSDCTAELLPAHDNRPDDDSTKDCSLPHNLTCFTAQNAKDHGMENESAGKTTVCSADDADRRLTKSTETGMDALTTSEPPTTNHSSSPPSETTIPCTVTTTTTDKTGASTTKPTSTTKTTSAAAAKTTSTTACTTSSTSTTSSSKSERPRASPCRVAQTKHISPVTNSRDSKPPCKAAAAAAAAAPAAKQSSSISNAAAAKLLVDMVGRSKSTAGTPCAAGGGGGQCKLTQCTDKIHADPAGNVAAGTDGGSCTAEKTSRNTGTPAAGSTGDRKDGKFCECWHCEFFGHMSVSV